MTLFTCTYTHTQISHSKIMNILARANMGETTLFAGSLTMLHLTIRELTERLDCLRLPRSSHSARWRSYIAGRCMFSRISTPGSISNPRRARPWSQYRSSSRWDCRSTKSSSSRTAPIHSSRCEMSSKPWKANNIVSIALGVG